MRIAIFHNLPSGGAKRTLGEIVRRLSGRHEIDIYTLSSADHQFADLRCEVDKHIMFDFRPTTLLSSPFGRLNQAIRLYDLGRLERLNRKVAAMIDEGEYQVAFVQPCRYEGSPSVLNYLSGTPSVYYCQEALRILYEQMPSRPYDRFESYHRRLLNRIDFLPGRYRSVLKNNDCRNIHHARTVLVNSNFSRKMIAAAYGINPEVSYLGVDTNTFQPMQLPRERWVLSVGSITPLKGFDFLIRAIARIPNKIRPGLKIVSNFENHLERDYLSQLASENGVVVEIIRGARDEDLVRFYNQAAMTVYAPIREPFGLVAIESMACGTPIVAVDEGGIQETVVHDEAGLLVERDEEEFAHAITSLLQNPELGSAYGINGRREVEQKWTWDRAVDRIESALDEAARQFPGHLRITDPIAE